MRPLSCGWPAESPFKVAIRMTSEERAGNGRRGVDGGEDDDDERTRQENEGVVISCVE